MVILYDLLTIETIFFVDVIVCDVKFDATIWLNVLWILNEF